MTGATDEELLAIVHRALVDVAPGQAAQFEQLSLSSRIDNLELDSIAIVEMVGIIENTVGNNFPLDEIAAVRTVQDIVDLIRTGSSAASP